MKFHYAVTLERPGEPANKNEYRAHEARTMEKILNILMEKALANDHWSVEPARPELVATGLVAIPFERPAGFENFPRHEIVTTEGDRRGGALHKPDQINIDARHATFNEPSGPAKKFARCGNCGTRYEISDNPVENHHRAMQHKTECGKGSAHGVFSDRQELLAEFHEQPMQREFRERLQAAIEAGADPEKLAITGVSLFAEPGTAPQLTIAAPAPIAQAEAPARWWQFWKWFR